MTSFRKRKFHVKPLLLVLLLPCFAVGQRTTTTTIEVKPLPILPAKDIGIHNYVSGFTEIKALPSPYYEWYYWTNYSRQKPKAFWDSVIAPVLEVYPRLNTSFAKSLKKDLYQAGGLGFVKPNQALLRVAQSHASDLSKNAPGRISHNSTNGTAF